MTKTVVFLIFFVFMTSAKANDFFVAKSGNDNNTGSIGSPFLTIQKGIAALNLAPRGQAHNLYLREGTYSEVLNGISSGTSWNTAITVSGYLNEVVTLNPTACEIINFASNQQYIIFKNMILDGTNLVKSLTSGCYNISLRGNYIRFQNLEVKNSPWNGIIGGGSYHEFLNLKVHPFWNRRKRHIFS